MSTCHGIRRALPVMGALAMGALVLAASERRPSPNPVGPSSTIPQPVTVELIAEQRSLQPAGTTRVGVHFKLEPGWHIYAEQPGDAGLPTQVRWSSPVAVVFEPLRWPHPEQFVDPGNITTFGYTGSTVLSSTLHGTPSKVLSASVPVHADVRWLACKEVCVPGSATLDLTLRVSTEVPAFSAHAELFDHAN